MPSATKLHLNDDGTVTVPLRPKDGAGREPLLLTEPSMRQLCDLFRTAREADDRLPTLPPLGQPTADGKSREDINRERAVLMYKTDAPHAKAFIKVVKLLADVDVTPDDLYGWAVMPGALNVLLDHFSGPLDGEEQRNKTQEVIDLLRGG